MKRLIEYYVLSNIHIALSAFIFFLAPYWLLEEPAGLYLVMALTSATLLTYNAHRLIGLMKISGPYLPSRFIFAARRRTSLVVLSATALIAGIYSLSHLTWTTLLMLVPPVIITALYLTPALPGGKRLRDLSWIKIFLIAGVWSYLFVLPLFRLSTFILPVALLALEHFFFFLALTLPFDMRDAAVDRSKALNTLGNTLSTKNCLRFIAINLLLAAGTAVILGQYQIYSPALLAAILLFYVVLFVLIKKNTGVENEMYYLGILDGFILVKGLLYLIH